MVAPPIIPEKSRLRMLAVGKPGTPMREYVDGVWALREQEHDKRNVERLATWKRRMAIFHAFFEGEL